MQAEQKTRVIDKQKKRLKELEDENNKAVEHLQKKMEDTYKFVCALRLDMIADKLELINPQWSKQIDHIANLIEQGEWENG